MEDAESLVVRAVSNIKMKGVLQALSIAGCSNNALPLKR